MILFMIRGYRKGFIRSLASIISLAASVVLVSFVTPYVSEFLQTQTPIYVYVNKRCQDTFTLKSENTAKSLMAEQPGSEQQEQIIDTLPVPGLLKNMLKSNNTTKTYQELAVKSFNEYVPKFMASLIMNIISFVLTWILVASFIWLAVMTLDGIANLPIIHGVNQLLGLALGFVQGLVIVWIVFLAITVFSNTQVGADLLKMISESPVLRGLYDANIFLQFLQGLRITT